MTSPLRELGGIRAFLQLDGAEAFDRAVNSVNGSLDLTQVAAGRAAAALGKTDTAMVANSRSATSAASGSAKYKAAVLSLVATQERLNELLADEDATLRQVARAQASLITAQERVKATSPAAAIEKTTVAADASVGALGRAQKGLTGLLETGAKLGLALGGFELAREAVEFVSAGKDLTTSLNGVQAASHATDAEMVKVRAQAIALGKDLTVPAATAVDAADAIQDLVKAGIALPKAVLAARPALLLASATNTDMATTARVLGDSLDIFSLSGAHAAHVADILATSTNSASHDLPGLFNAIKYAGPAAQALGISIDSVVTAITELAKNGINESQAGAGIQTMLTSLSKDTPKSIAALDDMKVHAFDAQGAFVGFPSLFEQLHKAQARFGTDSEAFQSDVYNAFGARGLKVVELFAKEGVEGYDKYANKLASGSVQAYADDMNRGVAASAAQLKKELTAVGVDVYDKLEGPIDEVLQWLGTDLPKDLGTVQDAIRPVEQAVGHDFVTAWHAASDVLGVADHALVDIGHVLEGHSTTTRVTIEAVLSLWAAYKGYQIVTSAAAAIKGTALAAKESITASVTQAKQFVASRADMVAAETGFSRAVSASSAGAAAAEADLAAATKVAAAEQAEAYARSEAQIAAATVGTGSILAESAAEAEASAATEAAAARQAANAAVEAAAQKRAAYISAAQIAQSSSAVEGAAFLAQQAQIARVSAEETIDRLGVAQAIAASQAQIAASLVGTGSILESEALAAAAASATEVAAFQAAADGAVSAAAIIESAAESAAETVTTEGEVASAGWGAMLGPLGIAAGAVGLFATMMFHSSGDTAAATAALDDYTESVKKSTDALSAANLAQTNDALAKKGSFTLLDLLKSGNTGLALTYGDLTKGVNGTQQQFSGLIAQLSPLAKGFNGQAVAAKLLIKQLTTQRDGIKGAITQQKELDTANKQTTGSTTAAAAAATGYAGILDTSTKAQKANKVTIDGVTYAMQGEAAATGVLSDALDVLSNNSIDAEQAQLQFRDSLAGVAAQEKKNGASLADNTAKGRANKESLLDQIKSINGVASAQIKNGASVSEVTKRLGENLAALKKSYVQNGYNAAAVDKLIKKYAATPKQVVTAILADTTGAVTKVKSLQALINAVRQNRVPSVDINTTAGAAKLAQLQIMLDSLQGKTVTAGVVAAATQGGGGHGHSARGSRSWTPDGRLPRNTVSTVGEQGWEAAVTDASGRTAILSHKASMRLLGYGERVPGFAAGTGGTIPNTLAANGTGISTASGHKSAGLGEGNPLDPFGWGSVYRAGVTGTASSVLFGASHLIGQALLTGVQSVKGAILVETESTTRSMKSMYADAAASVQKQVTKSVAPGIPDLEDPTIAGGSAADATIAGQLSGVLGKGIGKATTAAQSAAIAKANLATLKAHAKALDDDATSAKKNANQADAAAKAAATHASTVKGDKNATDADKKAAEDHATALQKQADQMDKTAKSSANLAKAADNLASRGDAAYKKLQTASSNASKAAQQDAQNIVSSFDSMVSDFLSTVSSFQSEISSGIEGGTSLSSIWSGFGDAVSQASDNLDQAVATWQDAVATGGDVASALTSMTQAQQLYNGAISNMSVGNLQNSLTNYLNQITQFSTDLQAVAAEGGGQALIEQIVSLGPTAGDQLAKALLQAGQGSVDQVSDTLDKINQTAANAGIDLSTTFFGQGEDTITQLIKGMEQQFPALDKALQPIEAKLQAAFTITPVVNPPQDNSGGSGGGKPGGKHAHGGLIGGVGTSLSDSNEEWLSRGEIVENAQAAAKYKPLLLGLNSGIPLSALLPSPVRVTPQAAVVNDNAAVVAAVQDMHKSLDGRLAALEDFAAGSTADQIGRQVGAHVTRSASLFGEAAAVQAQRDRRTGKRVG